MKTLKIEQNETSDAQGNASLESIHNSPTESVEALAAILALPTRSVKHGGDDDIVIHERTGERFNKRTGEFVW
jgi:hypothetical protein